MTTDPERPTISLLGPLTITAPGKRPQSPARARELVAFLSLHPWDSHELLDQALWPHQRVTTQTRAVALHHARTWLGTNPDGQPWVCFVHDHGYRLRADLKSDWDQFTTLTKGAPAQASTTTLIRALSMVRGQPMTGINPTRYAWADLDRQTMITAVADTADELTTRALTTRQARLANWAAALAITVEPGNEHLWRQRIRAGLLAANPPYLNTLTNQLHATLDNLGPLEEKTTTLLHQLQSDITHPN